MSPKSPGQHAWRTAENRRPILPEHPPARLSAVSLMCFHMCGNLTEIKIPRSVKTVGDHAFMACEKIKDVFYEGTEKEWNKIDFGKGNEFLKNAEVHFKCGSEEWK